MVVITPSFPHSLASPSSAFLHPTEKLQPSVTSSLHPIKQFQPFTRQSAGRSRLEITEAGHSTGTTHKKNVPSRSNRRKMKGGWGWGGSAVPRTHHTRRLSHRPATRGRRKCSWRRVSLTRVTPDFRETLLPVNYGSGPQIKPEAGKTESTRPPPSFPLLPVTAFFFFFFLFLHCSRNLPLNKSRVDGGGKRQEDPIPLIGFSGRVQPHCEDSKTPRCCSMKVRRAVCARHYLWLRLDVRLLRLEAERRGSHGGSPKSDWFFSPTHARYRDRLR